MSSFFLHLCEQTGHVPVDVIQITILKKLVLMFW